MIDVDAVEPIDVLKSASWAGITPQISVIVATHDRAGYLGDLFAALAAQVDAPPFEVVIADDGSSDNTWAVLAELVASTSLSVTALKLRGCGGPSIPRNTAVQHSRAPSLAITDDDCLPSPRWLAALTLAVGSGAIAQGATVAAGAGRVGPWDRTIEVNRLTGLWESCNLAVPRSVFDAVGGFPVLDLLPHAGRGFGEDTVFGAAAARLVGATWTPDAVVAHRWIRSDYLGYLDTKRRIEGLPALVQQVPELRSQCYLGRFRNKRSAECDLAVAGLALALVRRRPVYLLAALPWLRTLSAAATERWGRPQPVRMAQEGLADLVALGALIRGSATTGTLLG